MGLFSAYIIYMRQTPDSIQMTLMGIGNITVGEVPSEKDEQPTYSFIDSQISILKYNFVKELIRVSVHVLVAN